MDNQKQVKKERKRSTLSWIMEFAGSKKSSYVSSVLLAILSVLCGFIPYTFMAKIVRGLLEQTVDFSYCMKQCLWMALFYLLDRLFHAASTTMSHKATFEVLANVRRQLTKKLAKMPLGDVLAESSGTYKNIIVERVDSIETTLAHMIPEVTSNLIIPFVIFAYMLRIDWRLALLSLITVPIGGVFFMLMMVGSGESYENTVVKTKALNDTAVEYIGGIEVIKAFGKAKTSYEKFVIAAKEGADCFIEWMRRCNVYQNASMILMPATLLSLLPFGVMFYMKGAVSGPDLLMLIILSMGLISPIVTAVSYMDDVAKMGTIVGEVTDILEKPELERPDTMTEQIRGTDIELRDVHFAYKEDEVLHGVNISIKAGTVNALVGLSGSGKSTIAKLIASFWDVGGGSITFGGVDIRNIPLDDYQKKIAMLEARLSQADSRAESQKEKS